MTGPQVYPGWPQTVLRREDVLDSTPSVLHSQVLAHRLAHHPQLSLEAYPALWVAQHFPELLGCSASLAGLLLAYSL